MATKRALVIVESPTKVKTIQKYLDSKYVVKASMRVAASICVYTNDHVTVEVL